MAITPNNYSFSGGAFMGGGDTPVERDDIHTLNITKGGESLGNYNPLVGDVDIDIPEDSTTAVLPLKVDENGRVTNNGNLLTVTGNNAWAEGERTEATAGRAHAEGYMTKASAADAHAEGSNTRASGEQSHAEGAGCTASGKASHAGGRGTRMSADGGTAVGNFNSDTTALFVVGNGTDANNRNDAFKVDPNGQAHITNDSGNLVKIRGAGIATFTVTQTDVNTYVYPNESDVRAAIRNYDTVILRLAPIGGGFTNYILDHQAVAVGVGTKYTWVREDGSRVITLEGSGSPVVWTWNESIVDEPKIIYSSLQDAISDNANLSVGDIFETNGFHTSGDGGAARYVVSSTGTANGMDIVQLATGKLAVLQVQDFAYPDQFGYVRNDNSSDVVPFIDRIFATGILHIKLHWGRYYMRQTLNMPIASSIEGVARAAYDYPAMSRMLYMVNTGTCAINVSNYDVCLENFDLYCSANVSGKIGVLTNSYDNSQRGLAFRNFKISGFQTSVKLSASANWVILFDRVTFEYGEYGLWMEANKLVINLSDCYFNGITEEDVHTSHYSSALSFSHCNFGCRKKVFKNEWNNYDWRNFGNISFYGCHFEVDLYDLADVSGCFIDIDDDCQVSLVFVGCDFNADKANPSSVTCFKFGNRTRASYIGCHGKESQYVHFDGDFFDPDYPPEPYVGSLKLDAACVGLKEPSYDTDHSMCFVDEAAVYEGYTRKNPLNIFDNIVVNYSYAGVRDNGGTLEFFTPTPPQSCASIVVDIPPEYRNTTLTLSCLSGTHNNWYVVGTPVHPDTDRTQTPELLSDTYQTGSGRDYCSINMNGNRYLLFYYYLMPADGNPEKFAMSESLMISKGSQYTPYAKHIIVDKRGVHISHKFIPPVKSVGTNGAVPLASCNDLVPAENSIEICGEINTFGGTTDTPSGFSGFAMLHCSAHVNYTRLIQWFFGGNGNAYTRRAIRNSQSDPWAWQSWYVVQGTAL